MRQRFVGFEGGAWKSRAGRLRLLLVGGSLASLVALSGSCGGGSSGGAPITGAVPYFAIEWQWDGGAGLNRALGTVGIFGGSGTFLPGDPSYSSPESPSISADGLRIAFSARPWGGTSSKVFTMWNNGASLEQVTDGDPARNDTFPAWSPDGARLIFASDLGADSGLWTCDKDGFGLARLTTPPAGATDSEPQYSPDGTKILFVRNAGEGQVWIMDADGQNQKQMTSANFHSNVDPSWSPDGKRFAWTSNGPNEEEFHVWIGTIDPPSASLIDPIPYGTGTSHFCPRWGNGALGPRIFFILKCPVGLDRPPDCHDEIWSVQVDGSDLRQDVTSILYDVGWFDVHR